MNQKMTDTPPNISNEPCSLMGLIMPALLGDKRSSAFRPIPRDAEPKKEPKSMKTGQNDKRRSDLILDAVKLHLMLHPDVSRTCESQSPTGTIYSII